MAPEYLHKTNCTVEYFKSNDIRRVQYIKHYTTNCIHCNLIHNVVFEYIKSGKDNYVLYVNTGCKPITLMTYECIGETAPIIYSVAAIVSKLLVELSEGVNVQFM